MIEIAKSTGLEFVIIRPQLVYSRNAPGNSCLLVKLIKMSFLLPFGFTNNNQSYVSIDNSCDFISLCCKHPNTSCEFFVISDGKPVFTKTLTKVIASAIGKRAIQLPIPVKLMKLIASVIGKSHKADQLLGDLVINSKKAERNIGWSPLESMEEAMRKINI